MVMVFSASRPSRTLLVQHARPRHGAWRSLLDATVVRMVLVPATMALLGHRNWWLPAWLDRVLPRIDPEGHTVAQDLPGHQPELDPVG